MAVPPGMPLAGRAHQNLDFTARLRAFARPPTKPVAKKLQTGGKAALGPFCCHGMDMDAVNHLRMLWEDGDGLAP